MSGRQKRKKNPKNKQKRQETSSRVHSKNQKGCDGGAAWRGAESRRLEEALLYARCRIRIGTSAENAQISIMQSESNRNETCLRRYSTRVQHARNTHRASFSATEPVGVCLWECGGSKLATCMVEGSTCVVLHAIIQLRSEKKKYHAKTWGRWSRASGRTDVIFPRFSSVNIHRYTHTHTSRLTCFIIFFT